RLMGYAWPSLAPPSTTPIRAGRKIRTQIAQQAITSIQTARSTVNDPRLKARALGEWDEPTN
ncbi:MAG: hypothetical protein AABZ47_12100, partial [Planctomycetota bacterium]